MNWPNHATSDHCETQKIKIIRYFHLLYFDLAKGEASTTLAPHLVAPLNVTLSFM